MKFNRISAGDRPQRGANQLTQPSNRCSIDGGHVGAARRGHRIHTRGRRACRTRAYAYVRKSCDGMIVQLESRTHCGCARTHVAVPPIRWINGDYLLQPARVRVVTAGAYYTSTRPIFTFTDFGFACSVVRVRCTSDMTLTTCTRR